MSWRNNLIDASFRNVPFKVKNSATKFGRRVKLIQYWRKDNPKLYDYGPEADVFYIEGYIIQNSDNDYDYMEDRDNLIAALKKSGSGILNHPFYGNLNVGLLEPAVINESFDEGGIARFSMTFVQHSKSSFPAAEIDYVEKFDLIAAINKALLQNAFIDIFVTGGAFISSIASSITKTTSSIKASINKIKGSVASVATSISSSISALESLASSVVNSPCDIGALISSSTEQILAAGGVLGESVQGGITGGCTGDTYEGRTDAGKTTTLDGTSIPQNLGISMVDAMLNSIDIDIDDFDKVPAEQEDNQMMIMNSFKAFMVIDAARACIRIEFSSIDKMEYILNRLIAAIDALLYDIGAQTTVSHENMFIAVDDARSALIEAMYGKNTDLAKEIDYLVGNDVESALVVSYNKYDDISRDEEIFQRNKNQIRHPGFLPNGENIRILDE